MHKEDPTMWIALVHDVEAWNPPDYLHGRLGTCTFKVSPTSGEPFFHDVAPNFGKYIFEF